MSNTKDKTREEINISERLRRARQISREKHRESDRQKLGDLRAGNSGIMSESGDIAASCHRVAHLRQLGIDIEEISFSKSIMFERGFNNEDMIHSDLVATLVEGESIVREEEIPTLWTTTNGTKVTGRPDMVICKKELSKVTKEEATRMNGSGPEHMSAGSEIEIARPILGIEIKSIASFWTAKSVLFGNEPKLPHLAQAAHYMWQLNGIPFRLVYRQYANMLIPDWAWLIKQLPKQGEKNSEYISWNEKTGKPKQLDPFELTFSLKLVNERLYYKLEEAPESAWTSTLITIPDLVRYYEFVSKMGTEKILGPIPSSVDARGQKLNFSHADYCPVCKLGDLPYDQWLEKCKSLVK